MKRRNFLTLLAGALAAPALPAVVPAPDMTPCVICGQPHCAHLDVRTMLTCNAVRDIQYEIDCDIVNHLALINRPHGGKASAPDRFIRAVWAKGQS